jgi:hypothetical protein
LRIEAPKSFKEPLPPKHFVKTRNAAGKLVGGVKKCRIAIGD